MSTQSSTSGRPVLVHRSGAVATVTLKRPEAMNALDLATKEALLSALREAATDESVRCVVLTGSGRAFSVGQDLREHVTMLAERPDEVWRTVREHYNPIVAVLSAMDKPVIASLNGIAAGAGASLAFAADFRYVAESAGFTLSFAGVGLSCDSGASWTLPQLVGVAKAKELMMLGGRIDSAEALRLGLATEVVPDAELAEHVAAVAGRLAGGPTLALGAIRRAVAHAGGSDLASALAFEADLMDRTGASADHAGAVQAFLAKESPTFTGH